MASSLAALVLLKLLLVLALLLGLTLLVLELRHRLRPASPLRLRAEDFRVEAGSAGLTVSGMVTIHNPHHRMEVMVPEIELRPTLLGRGDLAGVTVSSRIEAPASTARAGPAAQPAEAPVAGAERRDRLVGAGASQPGSRAASYLAPGARVVPEGQRAAAGSRAWGA